MPIKPMCNPDGVLIRELIAVRGYSVASFARHIGRPKSERSIWRAIADHPLAVDLVRPVARGLRVKPSQISDWTGDDEFWDGPLQAIPAWVSDREREAPAA